MGRATLTPPLGARAAVLGYEVRVQGAGCRGSGQQAAGSRQQAAGSRQQAAGRIPRAARTPTRSRPTVHGPGPRSRSLMLPTPAPGRLRRPSARPRGRQRRERADENEAAPGPQRRVACLVVRGHFSECQRPCLPPPTLFSHHASTRRGARRKSVGSGTSAGGHQLRSSSGPGRGSGRRPWSRSRSRTPAPVIGRGRRPGPGRSRATGRGGRAGERVSRLPSSVSRPYDPTACSRSRKRSGGSKPVIRKISVPSRITVTVGMPRTLKRSVRRSTSSLRVVKFALKRA